MKNKESLGRIALIIRCVPMAKTTKENKLGIRGSDTHTLQFNDVKVPVENLLGEIGLNYLNKKITLNPIKFIRSNLNLIGWP